MKKIAALLGVSPGSVHLWTADIDISPAHALRNFREARRASADTWIAKNRKRRFEYQEEGRERARDGNALHEAGCMLYWAEGAKARGSVGFANSDPQMVRFFIRFLRECFRLPDSKFRLNVNVYSGNGLRIEEIESYWLELLQLPRSCLRGHIVDHFPTSSSGNKKNRLPYGVCHLRVHSTRIVQHIYGAIQEYGGFEEPRWLDCAPRKAQAESS